MNSDISSYVVRGFHRLEVSRTGRARARIGFLGRVILQVEERVETISRCPPPPGEKNDAEWREFCKKGETYRWRDATAFDCAGMPVLAAPEASVVVQNFRVPRDTPKPDRLQVSTEDSDPRIAQAQSEIAEVLTRLCNDTGLPLFSVRASGRYKHTADMPKCQAVSFNVKVMLEVPE